MLCGELLNGSLASAGTLSVPYCGVLPGFFRGSLSPRPLTGSPYLTLLAELLATAAYNEELALEAHMMDQEEEEDKEKEQQQRVPDRKNLHLEFDYDVDESVLLGELIQFIIV